MPFFASGLTTREKRVVFTTLPSITRLFLAGLSLGWFFTIPTTLQLLLNFGLSRQIEVKPTSESFFWTVTTLLFWNGLVFELPMIVYLLARVGLVNAKQLGQTRRYAIVIITIVAGIITERRSLQSDVAGHPDVSAL
jgi:sec-independent protein translocase protein TatC